MKSLLIAEYFESLVRETVGFNWRVGENGGQVVHSLCMFKQDSLFLLQSWRPLTVQKKDVKKKYIFKMFYIL